MLVMQSAARRLPCGSRHTLARACLALLWLVLARDHAAAQAPASEPALAASEESGDPHPSEPPPGVYRNHIDAALVEYRAHRFPEARALLTRAHAVFPNARTWRGLAMVEFELRNYVDAAALLARALADPVQPLSAALRETSEALKQRAEAFIGHYALESEQALLVSVDGIAVQTPGSNLALAVGDHVLELSAQGYASERRLLRVRGGERERLSVVLVPRERPLSPVRTEPRSWPAPVARALSVTEQSPYAPRSWQSKWLWTGVGVVSAALAIGLGFALTAHERGTEQPISARPIAIRSGP